MTLATFEDGSKLEVTPSSLTEEAKTGSELQEIQTEAVVSEVLDFLGLKDIQTDKVIDILLKHNLRVSDFQRIQQGIDAAFSGLIINIGKSLSLNHNRILNTAIGNEKLETMSKAYGATDEKNEETKNSMITMRDIFLK